MATSILILLTSLALSSSIECPQDCGTSCCETAPNEFKCCPYENGVCCADSKRCCPQGSRCDNSDGCINIDGSHQRNAYMTYPKEFTQTLNKGESAVLCGDRESTCPDQTTCCPMSNSMWGCCPFPTANCCAGGVGCCPTGYRCDTSKQGCVRTTNSDDIGTRMPVTAPLLATGRDGKQTAVHTQRVDHRVSVECGDGEFSCPTYSTCCRTDVGSWGCCPFSNATCCEDGVHCCPNGYTCDVADGLCFRDEANTHASLLKKSNPISSSAYHFCPDGVSLCDNLSTCCRGFFGRWNCCPHVQAICCPDGIHCCPAGYHCSIHQGICVRSTETDKWANSSRSSSEVHVCPDNLVGCPSGTCCKNAAGAYSCCPHSDAVCCSDGLHCCPKDFECAPDGRCVPPPRALPRISKNKVPWSKKVDAVRSFGQNSTSSVVCPGGQYQCSETETCCKVASGKWGCCPLPNAVCCSDGIHCCPNHFYCAPDGDCIQTRIPLSSISENKIPWSKKVNAVRSFGQNSTSSITCPGNQYQCSAFETCCKLPSDEWGCCPLSNAVCCTDNLHCCPEGTRCSDADQSCVPNVSKEAPALLSTYGSAALSNTICPDKSMCVGNGTCCLSGDRIWACCPFVDGVCCHDGLHCCPADSQCSGLYGGCVRKLSISDSTVIKASLMNPSPDLLSDVEDRVPVVNNFHSSPCRNCDFNSSCCPDKNGISNRMCCPHVHGICCADGKFCCPQGTRCGSAGLCDRLKEVVDKSRGPYLVPAQRKGLFTMPLQRHIQPLSGRIQMAKTDILLSIRAYRELKSKRRTVCPGNVTYCPISMQCCRFAVNRHVCLPKTDRCPTPNGIV